MPMTAHLVGASNGPPPKTAPSAPRADHEPGRTAMPGKRILLVEDEVFIAIDLRHEAEEAGATVTYARTFAEAMAAVEAGGYDGAILDVTLGGDDTCEPIADRLRRHGTPFVLHSGDLDRQGEVIATLDAPIVPKPAAPGAVIDALGRVMQAATRH